MDLTHAILLAVTAVSIAVAIVVPVVGVIKMSRIPEKDEAIDAATFLALKELRERFERSKPSIT